MNLLVATVAAEGPNRIKVGDEINPFWRNEVRRPTHWIDYWYNKLMQPAPYLLFEITNIDIYCTFIVFDIVDVITSLWPIYISNYSDLWNPFLFITPLVC